MKTYGKEFCSNCREEVNYKLEKKRIKKVIREKEYEFNITIAICNECNEEMNIPGLIDLNTTEIDEQYRNAENIISIRDIENLMAMYNIGKAPLSLALGFEETTITRYLLGQMPSIEYSNIMKEALSSPSYMKELLLKNKNKIADTAFKKALKAIEEIETLFSISSKLTMTIAYIFEKLVEVTPLTLQKLLYFIQGLALAINNQIMFEEDCEAWIHGPVYAKVYDLFKEFKYNPIEDVKFALFKGKCIELSKEEKNIIDLVINTFGMYGGKVLEQITHHEDPWIHARIGYSDDMPSNNIIDKASIKQYFIKINEEYRISDVDGLNEYIKNMLSIDNEE